MNHSRALTTIFLALVAPVGCGGAPDVAAETTESNEALSSAPGRPHTGNATRFPAQGDAAHGNIGACGIPAAELETQRYVALNVLDAPHDYAPLAGLVVRDPRRIGAYDNGRNCGRWVRVRIDAVCDGVNDGAENRPFCRPGNGKPGAWVRGKGSGATLDMIVSDACPDTNAWCRDDPNHVDLHETALADFREGGKRVDLSAGWNNDRITWEFIEAPGYQGDIELGFAKDAQRYYAPLQLTHLRNGIHAVRQRLADGRWVEARRNDAQGQVYVLEGEGPYAIKVIDAEGREINGGRVYELDLPPECHGHCTRDFTPVRYRTR